MYPRNGTVLFGGAHLMGDTVDGQWTDDSPEEPTTSDGETIPERLYTVNRDIMSEYVGVNRDEVSTHGFRPYRENGTRLGKDGNVVHNYGHGGSGVSMSWWSVLEAVGYVDDVSERLLPDLAAAVGAATDARGPGANHDCRPDRQRVTVR